MNRPIRKMSPGLASNASNTSDGEGEGSAARLAAGAAALGGAAAGGREAGGASAAAVAVAAAWAAVDAIAAASVFLAAACWAASEPLIMAIIRLSAIRPAPKIITAWPMRLRLRRARPSSPKGEPLSSATLRVISTLRHSEA